MNRFKPLILTTAFLFPLPALLAQAPAAPAPAGEAPTLARPARPSLSPRKDGHFLSAGCIDLAAVLPPPPAAGTPAALADLETVHMVQAFRTHEQLAWAHLIAKDNVFQNDRELGDWFNAANLPCLKDFIEKVNRDIRQVASDAKLRHMRPRPSQADSAVRPPVEVPADASYPSGHALRLFTQAAVLAEILPEKREILFERAHRAAWARVLGGVHFPTDDVGGRILAAAVVDEMRKSPAFQEGLRRCRAEVEPFLKGKAGGR